MKTLDNEKIDQLYMEISKYEKVNPGTKYGEDFPVFAMILAGSRAFEHWVIRSIAESLIMPMLLQEVADKNPEAKTDPAKMKELVVANNPYRNMFLKAIYLGYRLGREESAGSDLGTIN